MKLDRGPGPPTVNPRLRTVRVTPGVLSAAGFAAGPGAQAAAITTHIQPLHSLRIDFSPESWFGGAAHAPNLAPAAVGWLPPRTAGSLRDGPPRAARGVAWPHSCRAAAQR